MAHPIHWLYAQHGGALPETSLRCYLCGVWSAEERYSVQKGIADTFNSHYLAKCPSSPWLCAACQWYFADKSHPDFRKMSIMVWETGWKQWERATMKQDIEGTLLHGTGEDIYLVCSLSKKKHILLQAPLNAQGATMLAIQVEEQVAHVERYTWEEMDSWFMALLALGHGKGEILSGNLYGHTLRKHGRYAEALALSQELEPYRHSALLELLSYVTIVEDRKEDNAPSRNGDGTDTSSRPSPQSGLEPDGPRIQEQVPDGYLDASRKQRGGSGPHVEQPTEVSQPGLW